MSQQKKGLKENLSGVVLNLEKRFGSVAVESSDEKMHDCSRLESQRKLI